MVLNVVSVLIRNTSGFTFSGDTLAENVNKIDFEMRDYRGPCGIMISFFQFSLFFLKNLCLNNTLSLVGKHNYR